MAVSQTDVQAICSASNLAGHLRTAQIIVNEKLLGKGLSGDLLDQITIYLTAHFATAGSGNGGLKSKKVGEATETYNTTGDKDTGLKSTGYGQTAMLLDSSGTLADLNSTSS